MNTQDINRKNARKIFEWCKKEFGPSTINGPYPRLIFHKKHKGWAGHYDPWKREMHVYGSRHKTFMGFIGTIIHEYAHYLQPLKSQYSKLAQTYSYKGHPLEREANRMEQKYKWSCYYEVFSPKEEFQDIRE